MVTRAQLVKLDSRIDELAVALGTTPDGPIEHEVQLLWIEEDGSLVDGDGSPTRTSQASSC